MKCFNCGYEANPPQAQYCMRCHSPLMSTYIGTGSGGDNITHHLGGVAGQYPYDDHENIMDHLGGVVKADPSIERQIWARKQLDLLKRQPDDPNAGNVSPPPQEVRKHLKTQSFPSDFPPITPKETEVLPALFDQEVHARLTQFKTALSEAIHNRYGLSVTLGVLGEELHKKQIAYDYDQSTSDALAITGIGIAVFGMLLAPLTGGASEGLAILADTAMGVGTAAQLGGEMASFAYSTMSAVAARDWVDKATEQLEQDKKRQEQVAAKWDAFKAACESRFSDMRSRVQQMNPNAEIPDLNQYTSLVIEVHGLSKVDISEEILLAKGTAKTISAAKFMLGLQVIASVRVIYKLYKGISSQFLHQDNAIMPTTEAARLAEAGQVREAYLEGEADTQVAKYNWSYATKRPGYKPGWLFKKMEKKGWISTDGRLTMETAEAAKFGLSGVFKIVSLAFDIADLLEVKDKISHNSWSEASLGIERVRIRTEAQVQDMLRFRAILDPDSFAEDYYFIEDGRNTPEGQDAGKHNKRMVTPDPVESGFLVLASTDSHLNNPDLQFSDINITQDQYNFGSASAKHFRHRLSGKYVAFEKDPSTEPYRRVLLDEEIAEDEFVYYLTGRFLYSESGKVVGVNEGGHLISFDENYHFELIPGANFEQLVVPSYGYLKDNSGMYVVLDESASQIELVSAKPTERNAFALTSNSCLQHRFSGKCLKPDGASIVLETYPQSDCRWQWGEESDGRRTLRHIDTGKYLVSNVNLFENGGSNFSLNLGDQANSTWVFYPITANDNG